MGHAVAVYNFVHRVAHQQFIYSALNNSMRVNKIEAMYEVSRVNVKLCEVLIDAHVKITGQCKSI